MNAFATILSQPATDRAWSMVRRWVRRGALVVGLSSAVSVSLIGQTQVWLDTNGNTGGSGIANGANVTWDTSTTSNWSTASGGGSTIKWNATSGNLNATFSAGTDAGAAYTVTIGSSSTISNVGGLTFEEGNVTINGGTLALGMTSNVSVASGKTATVNSIISGTNFGLTANNSGTLVLTGNNTFTGAVAVGSTSTVRATTSVNALGTGAATLSMNGGTLQLADNSGLNFARNTTVTATSTITSDRTSTGAGTTQTLGTLSIGAQTLNITAGGNATTGTAGITFAGTTLTGSAIFDTGASTNLTLGAISGNQSFTKQDTGQLTLNTSSSRSSGTTTVSGGTLKIGSGSALGTTATSLALSGGTLDLAVDSGLNAYNTVVSGNVTIASDKATGSSAGVTQTLGTLTIGANTLSITAGSNVGSGTAGVAFGNTLLSASGTSFNTAASTSLTLGAISGNVNFTAAGSGQLFLNTASSRSSGVTTLSGGTLTLGSTSALGTTGTTLSLGGGTLDLATDSSVNAYNTTVTGSTTISSDKATASSAGITQTLGTLSIGASTLTINRGANASSGTGTVAFGATTLTATGATFVPATNSSLTLASVTGSGNSFTIGGGGTSSIGAITTGTGGVTYTGTGTATLTGTNTQTGTTTVSSGTVTVNSGATLSGNTAALVVNGGTLNLNASQTVAGLSGSGGTVMIGSGTTFTSNDSGTDTFSGALGSTGAFTKSGAGTLALNGAADSSRTSGTNTLSAGTLKLGSVSALGTTGTTLAISGGTLDLATDSTVNAYNTTVSGNATIASDKATASSAGIAQTLGTLTIGANTLSVTQGGNVSSGTAGVTFGATTLTGSTVFDTAANTNLTLGALTGNQSFTKQNSGNMTLTGASSRSSGTTTVSGGTLTLGNGTALGTTATGVTLSGGTLDLAVDSGLNAYNVVVSGNSAVVSDRATTGAGVTQTLGTLSIGANTLSTARGTNATSGTGGVTFGATTLTATGATFAPGANTLLTLGSVTGAGNSFTISGAGNASIGAITTTTGGVTASGTGTTTLTGTNTQTGTTTVSSGTLTVNSGATLSGSTAALVVNGGTLNLNNTAQTVASLSGSGGNINIGANNTFTDTDTSTHTYSGTLSSTDATGIFKMNGSGGTVTLSGNNTGFTGAVQVASGAVIAANTNALGTGTAGTTVTAGATLGITGGGVNPGNGTLTLNGTGATTINGSTPTYSGALYNVSGSNSLRANISIASNATISSGSSGTSGTPITFTVGTNSPGYAFDNSTPIDTNTIALGGNTVTFTGGDNSTTLINSRLTGSGNVTINVGTSGTPSNATVIYNSNMNTYTGTTTIANGTLEVETLNNTYPGDTVHTNWFGITGSSPSSKIVIGDGTGAAGSAVLLITTGLFQEVLDYHLPITINSDGKFYTQNAQSVDALTFNGGMVDVGTNGVLNLNNTVTVNASSSQAQFTSDVAGGGSLSLTIHNGNSSSTNRIFDVSAGTSGSADLLISNLVINNGSFTKTGNGTMQISSDNSTGYLGSTTVANGILNITNGHALGGANNDTASGTTVNGDGTTNGTLQLQNNITVANEQLTLNNTGYSNKGALDNVSGNNTWSGTILVATNATAKSDSGLLTLSGTIEPTAAQNSTLTIGGVGNTTISGTLQDNSSILSLAKQDSGKLIVSGSNNFSGSVDIAGGVLSLQNNAGFNHPSMVTVETGAQLQIDSTANGNITSHEAPLTLNGTGVVSAGSTGALYDNLGNNTYTGAVTLATASSIGANSGTTLNINGTVSSSNIGLTVGASGGGASTQGNVTLQNNDSTYTGTATLNLGSGSLTKENSGTLTINANSVGTVAANTVGAVALNGGTIAVGSGTTLNTGNFASVSGTTLNIATGGTVAANYTSNTTFAGVIGSGSTGTFEKDGSATLTLTSSFTASSATLVLNGGTLQLGTNGQNVTFGTIHITGNTTIDFGNSISTILSSTNLIIDAGVTVNVINWTSLSDEWLATTSFTQQNATTHTTTATAGRDTLNLQPQNQITFAGIQGGSTTSAPASQTTWITNTYGGLYILNEIRPTPEPSTYGAILLSGCLALLGYRRFRASRR